VADDIDLLQRRVPTLGRAERAGTTRDDVVTFHSIAVGTGRLTLVGLAAASCFACGRTPGFIQDAGGETGEVVEIDPCLQDDSECTSIVTLQRAADILFVIDNSGSMAEEQGTLAANFPRFVEVLEGELVGASYRIGITTTDQIGLRASSCRSRLFEFTWEGQLGPDQQYIERHEQQAGCLDSCLYDSIDLVPTSNGGGDKVSRPWLEKSSGSTNVPPGVTIAEALQCIGPQGINGYGYEMPLESMRTVLADNAAGFMREDALLAVVFVTDEADCSMSSNNDAWIANEYNPFWTYEDRPTSGVCWNAGVACDGGPGTYDWCWAQDKDRNGEPTSDAERAVLLPLERYASVLNDIANVKAARGGNGTVLVAVIAGVPEGYTDGAPLVYQDSADWRFNLEYGIGPGCGRGTESIGDPPGIPPVRLREFAERYATEGRNMFSICNADYAVALQEIAESIERLGSRACVPGCATDTNPRVDLLQPGCTVIEERSEVDGGDRAVPACVLDNSSWHFPNEATNLCYRQLTDPDNGTPWTHDDMSPQCVSRGSNLEFVVERREGVPVPPGVGVRVDCQLDGPVGTMCGDL
jgi:hypothetical protein